MSGSHLDQPFPRPPLVAAGVLVALALLAAGATRVLGLTDTAPETESVAMRDLRFEDRPDGSLAVLDADGRGPVELVAPGTNGFLRATLRGLVRERKRREIGPETPFRLSASADGHLTLADRATGRLVDLGAFGPTNAEAFGRFLERTP